MECFRLLFDHIAWSEYQFLSGIRDSKKAGRLWGTFPYTRFLVAVRENFELVYEVTWKNATETYGMLQSFHHIARFRSQIRESRMSSHTEELGYNETVYP